MKKLLIAASLLMVMSSCAKNEIGDGGSSLENSKIGFEATTNKLATRAGTNNPVTSTNDLQAIGEFTVSGFFGASTTAFHGVDNAKVTWKGASWEYDNAPYWPDGKINFVAHTNFGANAVTLASTGITSAVTIEEDILTAAGQKDMMVAVALEQGKAMRTPLVFKHALTQILFKAGTYTGSDLDVRIGGMRIVNVKKSGNMSVNLAAAPKISWTSTATQDAKYHVMSLPVVADAGFTTPGAAAGAYQVGEVAPDAKYATYEQIRTTATDNNQLLLVPQTFAAWQTATAIAGATGAYIEVMAIIRSKANTASEYYYCGIKGATDTDDIYGKVYIPVSSELNSVNEWVAGRRITYVITFGDKNSGSGGGGFDEDGNPILIPIKFSATVENWTDVDVPLLTATFDANSSAINAAFIDSYTKMMLDELNTSVETKVFKASVNISGQKSSAASETLAFAPTSTKIGIGSEIAFNFTGITDWKSGAFTITVPLNWAAQLYNGANITGTEVAAGTLVTLDQQNANKVVFTKKQ